MTNTDTTDFKVPDDWRGEVMTQIRNLIRQADPEITEEVKYKTATNPGGVLVWYRDGMITTGEVYTKHLRFTFSKGVALKAHDPKCLLNSYRAMLIHEEDKIDEKAFIDLIRAAVELNSKSKKK